MVIDSVYELCLPVLVDSSLEEEEKTDKLEELLRKETDLRGRPLQDAVLGALWRYRDSKAPAGTATPTRSTIGSSSRRNSPAPWQQVPRATTPLASPPLTSASPASSFAQPILARTLSSTISPYTSPRPSPRLAFASPIPHSPSLNNYQFSEPSSHPADDYGDFGSDTVDWLVNDDTPARPSSAGAGSTAGSTLSATAPAWTSIQDTQMSPYDMLRSVMGETKSDDEIELALATHDYDLSATLVSLMAQSGMYDDSGASATGAAATPDGDGKVTVGKSMVSTPPISIRQPGQARSTVPCKYWLQTGECLRADCRFSHDLTSHVCKYWMMGNCLAGDSCLFSHDPSALMNALSVSAGAGGEDGASAADGASAPSFQVQDYDAFPTLQPGSGGTGSLRGNAGTFTPSNRSFSGSFNSTRAFMGSPRSTSSRPTSRHSSRPTTPSHLSFNDEEAFPTLGSGGKLSGKKHHGKRGHGHKSAGSSSTSANPNSSSTTELSSMADVVRMSPGPSPSLLRKGLLKSQSRGNSYLNSAAGGVAGASGGSGQSSSENSAAARAISEPKHIPWLETGAVVNQSYIKARQDAFKHGGLRNKFLQSAAQAWNRNDARAAKALSLRGQSENELMRKAHREAARILYESRNQPGSNNNSSSSSQELYVDLHGLHPEEAVEYLERVLLEQQSSARPVYAITGTGHHSKNGKDKVGKAVRAWLAEWKYAFREFSVPGDRGNMGGILGIDARSFDRGLLDRPSTSSSSIAAGGGGGGGGGGVSSSSAGPAIGKDEDTKVRVVKEIPTGPKLAAV